MQSIEEKIYEGFWDKNIARMINRADLFSFLKQYVNPGLLTKSSKSYNVSVHMTMRKVTKKSWNLETTSTTVASTIQTERNMLSSWCR